MDCIKHISEEEYRRTHFVENVEEFSSDEILLMQNLNPLSKEFIDCCVKKLRCRVPKKRFDHSINVADTAKHLADVYGLDVDKAYLAGILHDWDKGFDDQGMIERAHKLKLDIDKQTLYEHARVVHGMTAALELSNQFPKIPKDVIQAIFRHTTATTDMSPMDMVIYVADAIEPNRKFDEVKRIRAMVGKKDLEKVFFEVYAYWMILIVKQQKTIYPGSIDIYNHYVVNNRDYVVDG